MLPDHQCTLWSNTVVLLNRVAEGFDSGTNAEFIRFLRYAKRSCTEVQSELYVALDEEYISPNEFKDVYEQARRTRAAIGGFLLLVISRNMKNESQLTVNREPDNLSSYEKSLGESMPGRGCNHGKDNYRHLG